jgi:TolA-binding protein
VLKETKGAMAAESKYQIANIQYIKKDYKKSKKTVFELGENYSTYENWVAKGYLLLAEMYLIEKDNFQAKATLQSIIENYDPNDAIKQAAITRLKNIIDEEEKSKPKPTPPAEKEVQPN